MSGKTNVQKYRSHKNDKDPGGKHGWHFVSIFGPKTYILKISHSSSEFNALLLFNIHLQLKLMILEDAKYY